MPQQDMLGWINMQVCKRTSSRPEGTSCDVVQLTRPSAAAYHTRPLWERSLQPRDLYASRDGDNEVVGQDVRAQGFKNAI